MFTGIIENSGKIISLQKKSGNIRLEVAASFSNELNIGQSVSHNGVCLTVETIPSRSLPKGNRRYTVTAVKETLEKTNLGLLKKGSMVNLERALRIGDRLDGHFVQGHVDTTATCRVIKKEKGSWLFTFKLKGLKPEVNGLIVEKGSICINGVSLTAFDVQQDQFSVAIIPHTFSHTNFNSIKTGDTVNIEFDVLGKYIQNIARRSDSRASH